ncbi:hypothetical protein QZH41_005718 [Actinostola sp. cb2023]|nr:hypothetical protein QZH41_005718 [Actinostola sp. cb2023]
MARSLLLDSNSSANEMSRMRALNIRALEEYHFFHLRLKMPPLKAPKKVRPSTASGILQSHDITTILDDIRPFTAPDKGPLGLDPTFITSRHHVPGVPVTSQFRGRQVHGGIPENDFKLEHGRRATIAGFEELERHEQPKRPSTGVGLSKQLKEADTDGNGTLDLQEFKNVIQCLFSTKFKSADQVTALFMKIDSSSDGEINWGCVNIFVMRSTGETLRNWKKMPKVEGIASVNIDSVVNSENTKFIRWKVHNDWVSQLRYYDSLRAVISCSNHQETGLVIGQTMGSTHIGSQMNAPSNDRRKTALTTARDTQPRRRLDTDQTVFRVYKGVKTFDFCKEKNLIITGVGHCSAFYITFNEQEWSEVRSVVRFNLNLGNYIYTVNCQ